MKRDNEDRRYALRVTLRRFAANCGSLVGPPETWAMPTFQRVLALIPGVLPMRFCRRTRYAHTYSLIRTNGSVVDALVAVLFLLKRTSSRTGAPARTRAFAPGVLNAG